MIRIYLKQAWETMRQNRLFSSIYVMGTGLSIALTMTLFIIFYVKTAPIYPEYNRNRTVVLKYLKCYPSDKPQNWHGGRVSLEAAALLDSLPSVQHMALTYAMPIGGNKVTLSSHGQPFDVYPLYVSPGFWRVFTLQFLSGKPFTETDNESRTRTVVISESLSRRLFATVDAAGRTLLYKGHPHIVSGVVRDVSSATPSAVADVWIPLSLSAETDYRDNNFPLLGNLTCYLTASTSADKETLKQEVNDAIHRYASGGEITYDLMGQPDDAVLSTFRTDSMNAPDRGGLFRTLLYIVLALLFIPAVNLSGMIASRMDRRTAELGIRKAYGATHRKLLLQVMCENFVLTLLGGVAGLLFSYAIVLTSGSWILTLFDAAVQVSQPTPFLTLEMLFNPWVFLCALGLCLVINVVSALVPAWWGLRHSIVQELYTKR